MPRFSKTQMVGLFMTGAAVGAAVALIYAPKTGPQMRRDIRRFSKRTANQLDDLQGGIREQVSEGYSKVRRMITNS